MCDHADLAYLISPVRIGTWQGSTFSGHNSFIFAEIYAVLRSLQKYSTEEMIKGKMPMWREEPTVAQKEAIVHPWPKPLPRKVALSVDGALLQSDGLAAAGMVLRRHDGSVIISAYRCIFNCNEALEAELHALM